MKIGAGSNTACSLTNCVVCVYVHTTTQRFDSANAKIHAVRNESETLLLLFE